MDNYRILIAEDFEPSRTIISEILESLGYEYETASNGYEAFFAVKEKSFDLVLMDIQMPRLNGIEATEYIRRSLPYPKNAVPIIVMTGWEYASELRKTYKEEGFDGFIEKPFSIDRLDELIDKLIKAGKVKKV